MATVADVLTRAYGYDDSFVQGRVANETTELVPLVDQLLKRYFARAAQINPRYFGATYAVAAASNKWTLPAGVIRFWRVENAGGTEIKVVSKDDTGAEFPPRVYQVGRDLFTVNEAGDPDETADTITVYANRYPTTLSGTGSTIDSEFPDHFYPLLEMGVAEYLARRAGLFDLAAAVRQAVARLEEEFDAAVAGYAPAQTGRRADSA